MMYLIINVRFVLSIIEYLYGNHYITEQMTTTNCLTNMVMFHFYNT